MVVLGALMPHVSGNFATRCYIIVAKFVNEHINYQLEQFENFSLFLKGKNIVLSKICYTNTA